MNRKKILDNPYFDKYSEKKPHLFITFFSYIFLNMYKSRKIHLLEKFHTNNSKLKKYGFYILHFIWFMGDKESNISGFIY